MGNPDPFTPKIYILTLLSVCHTFHIIQILRSSKVGQLAFRLFSLFLGTDIYLSLFSDNLSTNINITTMIKIIKKSFISS